MITMTSNDKITKSEQDRADHQCMGARSWAKNKWYWNNPGRSNFPALLALLRAQAALTKTMVEQETVEKK